MDGSGVGQHSKVLAYIDIMIDTQAKGPPQEGCHVRLQSVTPEAIGCTYTKGQKRKFE